MSLRNIFFPDIELILIFSSYNSNESLRLTAPEVMQEVRRLLQGVRIMRRLFAMLSLVAIALPVSAQDAVPVPTPAPASVSVVTSPTSTPARTGLFSRRLRDRNQASVAVTGPAATATTSSSIPAQQTAVVMEPTYNRRGKVIGYRNAATTTVVTPPKATVAPMPTPKAEPVSQVGGTVQGDSKVVQTAIVQPMPEPEAKRGLISRLGLRK
jgi:hypothetical protein